MGLKYSKVVTTVSAFQDWKLEGLDIVLIRSKVIGIAKKFNKSGIYFLTKDDLKWAFGLTDFQCFQCLQVFDFSNTNRISCLDFWCALTLTGVDSVPDKISFCFKLMDLNNDSYLSFNDVTVLIMCITRGISRMRGYESIPAEILDKIIVSAFKSASNSLNENGEISFIDFRNFIVAHDHARAYLSNLGTKIPMVDTSAIVLKRSNLQTEVANVQAEIAQLMCEIEEMDEDCDAFLRERGGDADFVKINASDLPGGMSANHPSGTGDDSKHTITPAINTDSQSSGLNTRAQTPAVAATGGLPLNLLTIPTSESEVKNTKASMVAALRHATKANAARKQLALCSNSNNSSHAVKLSLITNELRAKQSIHPSAKLFRTEDIYADEPSFLSTQSGSIFGEHFRNTLYALWMKMPRVHDRAADEMAELDEFTLMNLFDNAGVALSHHHARVCLHEYVPRNQIGKYNFGEILRWYQLYGSSGDVLLSRSPDDSAFNSYAGSLCMLYQWYMHAQKQLQNNLDKVKIQRAILNGIANLDGERVCKYRSKKKATFNSRTGEGSDATTRPNSGGGVGTAGSAFGPLVISRPDSTGSERRPSTAGSVGGGGGGDGSRPGSSNSTKNNNNKRGRLDRTKSSSNLKGDQTNNLLLKWVEFRNMSMKKPSTVSAKYFFGHPEIVPIATATTATKTVTMQDAADNAVANVVSNNTVAFAVDTVDKSSDKSSDKRSSDIRSPPLSPPTRKKSKMEIAAAERAKSAEKFAPKFKTVKLEEINDWKLQFQFSVSTNPFTNLSTKRPKDMSRIKIMSGQDSSSSNNNKINNNTNANTNKSSNTTSPSNEEVQADYIEDYPNLQSQDLLDFMNLREEVEFAERTKAAASSNAQSGTLAMQAEAQAAQDLHALLHPNEPFPQSASSSSVPAGLSSSSSMNSAAAVAPLKVYSSVSWFCVELKNQIYQSQELMTISALENYFLSIPYHLRQHIYSKVYVHGFNVYSSVSVTNTNASNNSNSSNTADKLKKSRNGSTFGAAGQLAGIMKNAVARASIFVQNTGGNNIDTEGSGYHEMKDDYYRYQGRRVILVALYHETDHFTELEKSLVENDVFITRAVHKLHFEMQVKQSLSELYKESGQFVRYEDKLYGPQESSLGEEGMNPLKYAKNIRTQKKTLTDAIAAITDRTMSREDMIKLCRQHGTRDTGTVAELGESLLKVLQTQVELLGFGEFSPFGRNLVEQIFNKFKLLVDNKGEYRPPIGPDGRDYDSGMLLWEFNKLLHTVCGNTMYDAKEYHALMAELELLLDKSNNLKLEGLVNYYLNNGRLGADNSHIGIGSLDASLKGKLSFNSTYEPDAVGSLLSLVGRNNILVDRVIQYVVWVSALRDLKVDGELDSLCELVDLLSYLVVPTASHLKGGNNNNSSHSGSGSGSGDNNNSSNNNNHNNHKHIFDHIRSTLKAPGWLATTISELSEYLADGDEGVIPTMRTAARNTFGKYDSWKAVFTDELVVKIREEVRAMEAETVVRLESELSERIEARKQQCLELEKQQKEDAKLRAMGITKAAPVSASASSGANDVDSASAAATATETVDRVEIESPLVIKTRRDELMNRLIRDTLPPLSEHNSSDLPAELLQLKEDLIFLSELRKKPDIVLTLTESTQIAERKETFLKRISEITEILRANETLLIAHSCALYDCIRLFGKSVSNVGAGSRDFCIRSSCEGLDFIEYLPEGQGEPAPLKQAYIDKVERAHQRKVAALAALERERLRRNMTDADREALRLEQLAEQMKIWAVEESQLYTEACGALYASREERKTSAELAGIYKLWEQIMSLKEERYPGTLQTAVSQNNAGCVLLEFYGVDHPQGAGSVYIFQAAAEILMTKARAVAQRIADERAKQIQKEEIERLRSQQQQQQHHQQQQLLSEQDYGAAVLTTEGDVSSVVSDSSYHVGGRVPGGMDGEHTTTEQHNSAYNMSRRGSLDSLTVASNVLSVASNQSAASSEARHRANDNKVNPFIETLTSVMESHEILPSIVILANYITALIQTDSRTTLATCFDMKNYVYDLLQLLSEKERERLDNGVINTVNNMDVMCYVKPKDCLEPIVSEIVYHFAEIQRREDEERQRLIDEAEAARRALEEAATVVEPVPLTKAQLRKEQKMRYAEQRRLDAIKRNETTKQRQMLYELIQSDQITAIFNSRSAKATMKATPKWGSVTNVELEEKDKTLGSLASVLTSQPSVAKSMKVNNNNTATAANTAANAAAARHEKRSKLRQSVGQMSALTGTSSAFGFLSPRSASESSRGDYYDEEEEEKEEEDN